MCYSAKFFNMEIKDMVSTMMSIITAIVTTVTMILNKKRYCSSIKKEKIDLQQKQWTFYFST